MKKLYFLIACTLMFFKTSFAQQNEVKSISVDFQQVKIEQFVKDLESKTNYHFYYDPMQFDSVKFTLQATDKSLRNVLDMAFQNTAFHYAIADQQVFLTKGREI